jgi:nucleoside-diphosphate-sugar epimerase
MRVARLMAERGHEILAASRDLSRLAGLAGARLLRVDTTEPETLRALSGVPAGCVVLHSVPVVDTGGTLSDPTPPLLAALGERAARVVYLSTTSVYGSQEEVDENTEAAPRTRREKLRVQAEQAVRNGPWGAMILRPAAIYGPGRGIQVSMPRGEFRLLGDGSNWVSRIHVEDLAELASAALVHDAGGAWPVADIEPARSKDIAAFVAELVGCEFPGSSRAGELHSTRWANRRVDGSAVFRLLNVQLKFPSFRTGIPASLGL